MSNILDKLNNPAIFNIVTTLNGSTINIKLDNSSHTHLNMGVLEKLTADNGELLFDNEPLKGEEITAESIKNKLATLQGNDRLDASVIQNIPVELSELIDDSAHRLVTDENITNWNNKQNNLGYIAENILNKNQNNGYCGLDSGGKVPISNLPTTLLKYQGVWNASINAPVLNNPDLSKSGNVYNVGVAGTQFGINFNLGDWLIYNSNGIPEKSDNSDDVTSVNGQTGSIILNTSNISESANKKYVTDSQLSILNNTSGLNTGDETKSTIINKLGVDPSTNNQQLYVYGGNPSGGTTDWTSISGSSFTSLALNNASGLYSQNWDNTNYRYTIPISGTYYLELTVRVKDGSSATSVGFGISSAKGDSSDFNWTVIPSGNRFQYRYSRKAYFSQNQLLYPFWGYPSAPLMLSGASMTVIKIS